MATPSYRAGANLQPAPIQGKLFDRVGEASAYHDTEASGFFSLLYDDRGKKRQESYRLIDMPTVLAAVDVLRDTWISQCEYRLPNRRTSNFLRSGLLFSDLDTYKVDAMACRSAEEQTESLLLFCEAAGLPIPSLVVFSGRGLQAKWLLDRPIPAAALPRWQACQDHLCQRLAYFGADPAARDASRVLRLVDTTNTRSGQIVRVTHVERRPCSSEPARYNFEQLCEALLPLTRWEIEQARQAREVRRLSREAKQRQLVLLDGGREQTGNLIYKSVRSLAWARVLDLRTLAELRGGVHEGQRMIYLFWLLNHLAFSGVVYPGNLWHEAVELARQIDPNWHWHRDELSTLYRKAKDYADNKPVVFAGREYPALYTPRNDTLIRIFGITEDEQRHLKTIVSKDEVRRRDAEKKLARRRAAGSVSRGAYLAKAEARRRQALALAQQGKSWQQIATEMGASRRAVAYWLRNKSGGAKSVLFTRCGGAPSSSPASVSDASSPGEWVRERGDDAEV